MQANLHRRPDKDPLAVMVESDVVGGPSVSSSRKWFRLRVLAARLADQARRLIGDLVRPQ